MKKIFLAVVLCVGSILPVLAQEEAPQSEVATVKPQFMGHKGLDFSINTGLNIATKGGGVGVPVDIMLSKKFTKNFAFGIGAGVDIPTKGDAIIPIFADFKGFVPLQSTGITPYLDVRLGYAINTADDVTVGKGNYKTTVEMPNFFTFAIVPSVRFPLGHRCDFDCGIGYEHFVGLGKNSSGSGSGNVVFRAGFNFHKSTNPNRVKKPKFTHDSGFEFGFDIFGWHNAGLDLILGYKIDPRFSVAIGGGIAASTARNLKINSKVVGWSEANMKGNMTEIENESWSEHFGGYQIFVRGTYRALDKRFSPIAMVDLGITNGLEDFASSHSFGGNGQKTELHASVSPAHFFVRPAVGVSLRCGKNSYLEARVGYDVSGSKKNTDCIKDGNLWSRPYDVKSAELTHSVKGFSGLYVGIGWKHTFGLFSRH